MKRRTQSSTGQRYIYIYTSIHREQSDWSRAGRREGGGGERVGVILCSVWKG